ncbi:MAG: hypothetical protein JWN86_702 [Planctomycetota bacterium]|nr:hypothetical protein [Planctomycetota bacterium]
MIAVARVPRRPSQPRTKRSRLRTLEPGESARLNWPGHVCHGAICRVLSVDVDGVRVQVEWGEQNVSGFLALFPRHRLRPRKERGR